MRSGLKFVLLGTKTFFSAKYTKSILNIFDVFSSLWRRQMMTTSRRSSLTPPSSAPSAVSRRRRRAAARPRPCGRCPRPRPRPGCPQLRRTARGLGAAPGCLWWTPRCSCSTPSTTWSSSRSAQRS